MPQGVNIVRQWRDEGNPPAVGGQIFNGYENATDEEERELNERGQHHDVGWNVRGRIRGHQYRHGGEAANRQDGGEKKNND